MTPARILPSSSFSVRAWIAPAAAIFSISAGVFLMITARLFLEVGFERSVAIAARTWSWTSVGDAVPSMRCSSPRSS